MVKDFKSGEESYGTKYAIQFAKTILGIIKSSFIFDLNVKIHQLKSPNLEFSINIFDLYVFRIFTSLLGSVLSTYADYDKWKNSGNIADKTWFFSFKIVLIVFGSIVKGYNFSNKISNAKDDLKKDILYVLYNLSILADVSSVLIAVLSRYYTQTQGTSLIYTFKILKYLAKFTLNILTFITASQNI